MLKLEKKSGDREISVILHQRYQLWNKAFFQALLYALGIHLIGFLIFSIQVFLQPQPIYLSSTIVDMWSDPSTVQTEEKQGGRYPFFLPASKPQIPPLPEPYVSYETKPKPVLSYMPVQIYVSGNLAEHEQEDTELFAPAKTALPLREYALHYNVQVDDLTGKIFWYQAKENIDDIDMERLGEKILSTLRFKKKPGSAITVGTIDLMITQPRNSI